MNRSFTSSAWLHARWLWLGVILLLGMTTARAEDDFLLNGATLAGRVLESQCQVPGSYQIQMTQRPIRGGLRYEIHIGGSPHQIREAVLEVALPGDVPLYRKSTKRISQGKTRSISYERDYEHMRFMLGSRTGEWAETIRFDVHLDTKKPRRSLTTSARLLFNAPEAFGSSTPHVLTTAQWDQRGIPKAASSEILELTIQPEPRDSELIEGVAGVRLLLEDGTYVTTDAKGRYHIEGIRPGTHVLQLDHTSLPENLQVVSCADSTRRAGSAASRFVDLSGGVLWQEDFYLAPAAVDNAWLSIDSQIRKQRRQVVVDVSLESEHLQSIEGFYDLTVPYGYVYAPGSSYLDGELMQEPQLIGEHRIRYRNIDLDPKQKKQLQLRLKSTDKVTDIALLQGHYSFYYQDELWHVPGIEHLLVACGKDQLHGCDDVEVQKSSRREAFPAMAEHERGQVRPLRNTADTIADFDTAWLESQSPDVQWLMPGDGFVASVPATSIAVQHRPKQRVRIYRNGEILNPLHLINTRYNQRHTFGRSYWQGVPLDKGENRFVAQVVDEQGQLVKSFERVVYYTEQAARAHLKPGDSWLVADGRNAPRIVVEIEDYQQHRVSQGVTGKASISAPYLLKTEVDAMQRGPTGGADIYGQFVIGPQGKAVIELEPTLQDGPATLTLWLDGHPVEIDIWIKSQPRDWVLVGLVEGALGYNEVSGNAEQLPEDAREDDIVEDGRVAFYARGRIKGEWLLTAAYDSNRRRDDQPLHQLINPDEYFTLYGDTSQQQYNASSRDQLYVRLSREQFQLLYGDVDIDLDDTDLGRYQRSVTGLTSQYRDQRFEYDVFIADETSRFVKDELRGNGTSGLYFLSAGDIVINSEKVVLETRQRFRSEEIIERQELRRYLDYDIDYTAGTLFFKRPVTSRDSAFNPRFIVVDYETEAGTHDGVSAGGRGAVKFLDERLEIGASYIDESRDNADGQLQSIDATAHITKNLELRLEGAQSDQDGTANREGGAWLAELNHRNHFIESRVYAREQEEGFGLGQQNRVEQGTSKQGAHSVVKFSERWRLNAEVLEQENLATGSTREVREAQLLYSENGYDVSLGRRRAIDEIAGNRQLSDLYLAGVAKTTKDGKIKTYIRAEADVDGAQNIDHPDRYITGVELKVSDTLAIYSQGEYSNTDGRETGELRAGVRSQPWLNATADTSVGSRTDEYGARQFASLGLLQTVPVSERLSLDFGLDGSFTNNDDTRTPFDEDLVATSGTRPPSNFVAASSGVNYRGNDWSLGSRLEFRSAGEVGDQEGILFRFQRKHSDSLSYSLRGQRYQSDNDAHLEDLDIRFSTAWRPLNRNWYLLNRLEFIKDTRRSNDQLIVVEKWLNNGRWNQRFGEHQLGLFYGTRETGGRNLPTSEIPGLTQLLGVEYRYNLNTEWDIGWQSSTRYRFDQRRYQYALGPSVGWSPVEQLWLTAGLNFTGFEENDLSANNASSRGLWLKLRFKFDQDSLRSWW